jgi:hypothetical protein
MQRHCFSIRAAAIALIVDFIGIVVSVEYSGLLRLHRQQLSPVGMWCLAFFLAPYTVIGVILRAFTYRWLSGLVGVPLSCIVWACIIGLIWPLVYRRGTRSTI